MRHVWCRRSPCLRWSVPRSRHTCPGQNTGQPSTKNGEWPMYTADLSGSEYSPLDQINASNFSKLEVAWRFKTDNLGPRPENKLEGTPIMVKGTVYATAGTRRVGRRAQCAHRRDEVDVRAGRGRARHPLGAAPAVGPRPLLLDRRPGRRAHPLRHHRLSPGRAERQDRRSRSPRSAPAASST